MPFNSLNLYDEDNLPHSGANSHSLNFVDWNKFEERR